MTNSITASELADLFERVGSWGLQLKDGYALGTGNFAAGQPPAIEDFRRLIVCVEGGEGVADYLAYCRKNADESYEWIPLAAAESTILIATAQSIDESSNPQNISVVDPYALNGALNLARFTQARMRTTLAAVGTSDVTGTLEYSIDVGGNWDPFLSQTIDFADADQSTDWLDIPAEAIGPDVFATLRLAVAGEGSASITASVYLDLRG